MVSHGFPSRRFPPSSSVNLIPSVSCSFRAAGGAMCSFRAAGGAMCAFRAAGGAMCAFRAAGGAMCAFRAAGGAMCAFRAAGGAMCAFRAAGGAMCSFRAAGGAMCAFRAAGGEMCLFRAAGGAMCLFRAAGGAICSFRAAGGAMCSFRAAGGAMCTFRAAGGAMCAFRAAGGAMCSFRAACGAMCAFRAAGAACCFFPDSRPFLPLYEERMTVAPPPASQPITDGHVAGQVGNGAARREAREVAEAREIASTLTTSAPHTHHPPPLITTLHLPPPPLPFIHLSPALTSAPLRSPLLPCAHLCSPALTSAPLRSPLLPCAHLCSPALTSAPLRSPLLPCTHLCSPALTSAPLRSPLLPCAHLCSPALTSAPLRSPLLPCAHLCSPALTSAPLHSPLLPCTHLCSPALTSAPCTHLYYHCFSVPRCSHHGFFPTVHPPFVPSVPSVHPSAIPACSPCSPHSLAMLPPPTHSLPKTASQVWEREVEHVSGGELQRFAVGVVGGQLGDRHLHVWEREVEHLSGGELQRFAIGVVAGQLGDISMFDEPSSYLDVRQRLKAAQVIRSLLRPDRYVIVVERDLSVLDYLSHFIYVIVVEHDLSVLDYLSDFICCLYGKPGAYGVVTLPFSVREGINIFLAGFVPTENLRFRDESLTFRVSLPIQSAVRGGINIFLAGFVLTENLRFRDEPLTFRGTKTLVDNPEEGGQDVQSVRYRYLGMIKKHGGFNLLLPLPHSILSPPFIPSQVAETPVAETPVDNPEEAKTYTRYKYPRMVKKQGRVQAPPSPPPLSIPSQVAETPVDNPEEAKTYTRYKYPRMVKKQGGFKLTVEPGDFTDSQIVVMLGENGTGKTTFIRMLVGKLSLMGAHAACTSLWLSLLPVPSMIHLPSLLSPFQAALSRPDPDEETGKEAQGWSAGLLKADPDEETGKEAEDLPEFNAGLLKADPDEETGKEAEDLPEFNVSYKPQKISPKFPHSVRALLHSKIRDSFHHPQFNTDVLRPMQIDPLLDQEVVNLSGGELQRVAITLCLGKIDPLLDQEVVKISGGELQRVAITLCLGKIDPLLDQEVVNLSGGELQRVAISLCLGKPADIYLIDEPSAYLDSEQRIVAAKPADIYLIDEPSAYLDSEQRIVAAKVIKRFILHAKKTAFVVEHDFIMATYLADRVIVYEGQPSVDCTARTAPVAQQRHEPLPLGCTHGTPFSLPFSPLLATVPLTTIVSSHPQPPPPSPPQQLDITFRRDPTNFRPRINKMDSVKDREQKSAGNLLLPGRLSVDMALAVLACP
ncbi:unnamed protein product [Closterium sp. NIES-64]|nr:unnamed protein product [Closterium sp. NIES-64]